MQAIRIDRYGPAGDLCVEDVARPVPGNGRILVRLHAASVNDWDLANVEGQFVNRLLTGLRKPRRPLIPGCDLAGVVEAVGDDQAGPFQPGDRVFGDLCISGFGAFAEYVCAPPSALARIPCGMTFAQAAAIPQAGILAWQALYDVGRLETRRSLLINGAGGGVGTFAIQLARRHDVEITAVDAPAKLDALRELGAHRVIDYTREDFTRSGRRYDLIVDTRTTRSPFVLARALAPGGAYATVGGRIPRLLQTAVLGPVAGARGRRTLRVVAQKPNKDLPRLIELFEAGQLEPVIDSRHALSDVAAALQRFARAEHTGKIVIEMLEGDGGNGKTP